MSTDVSEEHIVSIFRAEEIRSTRNQPASRYSCWFLAELISSALKMEAICSPKRLLTLNRLHGVISQKMILFITTTVKTSNPN
jgi:hypothetical protein